MSRIALADERIGDSLLVEGKVTAYGQPCAGATVLLVPLGAYTQEGARGGAAVIAHTLTDEQGEFRLAVDAHDEAMEVLATAEGLLPANLQSVPVVQAGGATDLRVDLARYHAFEFVQEGERALPNLDLRPSFGRLSVRWPAEMGYERVRPSHAARHLRAIGFEEIAEGRQDWGPLFVYRAPSLEAPGLPITVAGAPLGYAAETKEFNVPALAEGILQVELAARRILTEFGSLQLHVRGWRAKERLCTAQRSLLRFRAEDSRRSFALDTSDLLKYWDNEASAFCIPGVPVGEYMVALTAPALEVGVLGGPVSIERGRTATAMLDLSSTAALRIANLERALQGLYEVALVRIHARDANGPGMSLHLSPGDTVSLLPAGRELVFLIHGDDIGFWALTDHGKALGLGEAGGSPARGWMMVTEALVDGATSTPLDLLLDSVAVDLVAGHETVVYPSEIVPGLGVR